MDFQELLNKVNLALDELYHKQQDVFDNDTNEVTINGYFATYLRDHFADFNVDTEYNREHIPVLNITDTKRTITPSGKEQDIKPDIIIHGRNTLVSNLVVIECKKQWNKDLKEREKDKQILGGMTMTAQTAEEMGHTKSVFAYKYGLFVDYGETRKKTLIKKIINGTGELEDTDDYNKR